MTLRRLVGRVLARSGALNLYARVALIESDLDCDVEGSIAAELEDLRQEVAALRAVVEEFTSSRARAPV